ncbi:hypothetical protein F2P81_014424 [Scophthalmus maximus]|uniref:Uncharacterized protein n=1 Tax=Scophthalmus maximus TaxID=52904 RepID=A0A6A4SQH1_SCOMX|nr:hypothetical protein F2P81_014424 [Scophthalmus maximus]
MNSFTSTPPALVKCPSPQEDLSLPVDHRRKTFSRPDRFHSAVIWTSGSRLHNAVLVLIRQPKQTAASIYQSYLCRNKQKYVCMICLRTAATRAPQTKRPRRCNPACGEGGVDEIKQICLSKLFIKEAYLRYNPNMSSRAPGGIFGPDSCDTSRLVFELHSQLPVTEFQLTTESGERMAAAAALSGLASESRQSVCHAEHLSALEQPLHEPTKMASISLVEDDPLDARVARALEPVTLRLFEESRVQRLIMIVNTHHFPARTTCGLWRIGGKNWPCVDPDMSITLSGQGNGGPNVNTESIFVAAHKDARQISQRNDANDSDSDAQTLHYEKNMGNQKSLFLVFPQYPSHHTEI